MYFLKYDLVQWMLCTQVVPGDYDNTITWDLAIVGSIKILKARNIFESEHTLILLLKFIA